MNKLILSCLVVLMMCPRGEADIAWPPVEARKLAEGLNLFTPDMCDGGETHRAYEVYAHGLREPWGYASIGISAQTNFCAVVPPKTGHRLGAPLVVLLHSAGCIVSNQCVRGTGLNHMAGLFHAGNYNMYSVPDDVYALFPDCGVLAGADWWWGAEREKGPELSPCERRVLDEIEWTVRTFGIDRNRIYLGGTSMGGSGTLGIGLRHGDIFAAVKVNVPAGVEHANARLGLFDGTAAVPGLPDPPVVIDYSAPNDTWSAGHEKLIAAMSRGKYPFYLYWGSFGHSGTNEKVLRHNDLCHGIDWLAIRRDEAYPVFTNASTDDTPPWPCDAKKADTLPPGQINGYFRWKNVADAPECLAMELRLVSAAEAASKIFTVPTASTVDVTIRRRQHFTVVPRQTVVWTFGAAHGEVTADAQGMLTVPRLCVTTEPKVLTLRKAVLAAEAALEPVRPGDPSKGVPFWNVNAPKFIYPPAFDFQEHWMAKEYRFTVWGGDGVVRTFRAAKPWAPLTPVWRALPSGRTIVLCEGVSERGVVCLVNPPRTFWKGAAFTGEYPEKACSYREAAQRAYSYLFTFPPLRTFLETGRPDPSYDKNGYPSKTHGETIEAMVAAASVLPARKAEALKLARLAGETLLATSVGEGLPLEGWPLTYYTADGQACQRPEEDGTIMLLYPASVGRAYVALWKATDERKWLDAALKIASVYLKIRRPDGTWPLIVDAKTGQPTTANVLVPEQLMHFFQELGVAAQWWEYRAAAGACLGWMNKNVVADWAWEGQFEDVKPERKYANLTQISAASFARYLLEDMPPDAEAYRLAGDILRFCEDQFCFWDLPYDPKTGACVFSPDNPGSGGRGDSFRVPCVAEQYNCYNPVDSSAANMICSWIAYGKATGDGLALAKARALTDQMTRMQTPEGYVPTWWWGKDPAANKDVWINCHMASARALRLAAETFE